MKNVLNKINNLKYNVVLKNDVKEISKLEILVETLNSDWGLITKVGFNLNLVIEEVVSNIIIHGEMETEEEKEIILNLEFINNSINIEIKDNCKAFNPLNQAEKSVVDKLEDMQIGGLGIHFIKKLSKNLKYKRDHKYNILSFEILNHE